MPINKRYFDLIATGQKPIEVHVAYPSNKRLAAGQLLKFTCRGEECPTRIKRIASYLSFDEMFDHENVSTVNPTATRAEQLANIRLIYPAEKEALGSSPSKSNASDVRGVHCGGRSGPGPAAAVGSSEPLPAEADNTTDDPP